MFITAIIPYITPAYSISDLSLLDVKINEKANLKSLKYILYLLCMLILVSSCFSTLSISWNFVAIRAESNSITIQIANGIYGFMLNKNPDITAEIAET